MPPSGSCCTSVTNIIGKRAPIEFPFVVETRNSPNDQNASAFVFFIKIHEFSPISVKMINKMAQDELLSDPVSATGICRSTGCSPLDPRTSQQSQKDRAVSASPMTESSGQTSNMLENRIMVLKVVLNLSKETEFVDKLLKVVQYFARLWIAVHNRPKRFNAFIKTLSSSRKVLRLGRFFRYIPPLSGGFPVGKDTWEVLDYINNAVSLPNDIFDDISWASGMNLLPNNWGDFADYWSSKLWFMSAIIDLACTINDLLKSFKLQDQTEKLKIGETSTSITREIRQKRFGLNLLFIRFIADTIQSSDGALNLGASKKTLALCGLISSFFSTYRIYWKEKCKLEKKSL